MSEYVPADYQKLQVILDNGSSAIFHHVYGCILNHIDFDLEPWYLHIEENSSDPLKEFAEGLGSLTAAVTMVAKKLQGEIKEEVHREAAHRIYAILLIEEQLINGLLKFARWLLKYDDSEIQYRLINKLEETVTSGSMSRQVMGLAAVMQAGP